MNISSNPEFIIRKFQVTSSSLEASKVLHSTYLAKYPKYSKYPKKIIHTLGVFVHTGLHEGPSQKFPQMFEERIRHLFPFHLLAMMPCEYATSATSSACTAFFLHVNSPVFFEQLFEEKLLLLLLLFFAAWFPSFDDDTTGVCGGRTSRAYQPGR